MRPSLPPCPGCRRRVQIHCSTNPAEECLLDRCRILSAVRPLLKGADGVDPAILRAAARVSYIKFCFVVLSSFRLSSVHRAVFVMDPTRADGKRLTSEKASSHATGSNDPPAYSDYAGTATNGNDDEQLLARLGYKQVRGTSHTSQTRRPLTSTTRSSAASSTNGPQSPTPSQS